MKKLSTFARAISPFSRSKSKEPKADQNEEKESVEESEYDSFFWDLDEVDIDKVLEKFYKKYNPARVGGVDEILRQFNGEEVTLLQQLCHRYKVSEDQMQQYIDSSASKPVVAAPVQTKKNSSSSNSSSRRGSSAKQKISTAVNYSSFFWNLKKVYMFKALVLFYDSYNPDKTKAVMDILDQYEGDYVLLLQQLCERYKLSETDMQYYLDEAGPPPASLATPTNANMTSGSDDDSDNSSKSSTSMRRRYMEKHDQEQRSSDSSDTVGRSSGSSDAPPSKTASYAETDPSQSPPSDSDYSSGENDGDNASNSESESENATTATKTSRTRTNRSDTVSSLGSNDSTGTGHNAEKAYVRSEHSAGIAGTTIGNNKSSNNSNKSVAKYSWHTEGVDIAKAINFFYEDVAPSKSVKTNTVERKSRAEIQYLLQQLCKKYNVNEQEMQSYLDAATERKNSKSSKPITKPPAGRKRGSTTANDNQQQSTRPDSYTDGHDDDDDDDDDLTTPAVASSSSSRPSAPPPPPAARNQESAPPTPPAPPIAARPPPPGPPTQRPPLVSSTSSSSPPSPPPPPPSQLQQHQQQQGQGQDSSAAKHLSDKKYRPVLADGRKFSMGSVMNDIKSATTGHGPHNGESDDEEETEQSEGGDNIADAAEQHTPGFGARAVAVKAKTSSAHSALKEQLTVKAKVSIEAPTVNEAPKPAKVVKPAARRKLQQANQKSHTASALATPPARNGTMVATPVVDMSVFENMKEELELTKQQLAITNAESKEVLKLLKESAAVINHNLEANELAVKQQQELLEQEKQEKTREIARAAKEREEREAEAAAEATKAKALESKLQKALKKQEETLTRDFEQKERLTLVEHKKEIATMSSRYDELMEAHKTLQAEHTDLQLQLKQSKSHLTDMICDRRDVLDLIDVMATAPVGIRTVLDSYLHQLGVSTGNVHVSLGVDNQGDSMSLGERIGLALESKRKNEKSVAEILLAATGGVTTLSAATTASKMAAGGPSLSAVKLSTPSTTAGIASQGTGTGTRQGTADEPEESDSKVSGAAVVAATAVASPKKSTDSNPSHFVYHRGGVVEQKQQEQQQQVRTLERQLAGDSDVFSDAGYSVFDNPTHPFELDELKDLDKYTASFNASGFRDTVGKKNIIKASEEDFEVDEDTAIINNQYELARKYFYHQRTQLRVGNKLSANNLFLTENATADAKKKAVKTDKKLTETANLLAEDWVECQDPRSKRKYYYSASLKKSTWKKPSNTSIVLSRSQTPTSSNDPNNGRNRSGTTTPSRSTQPQKLPQHNRADGSAAAAGGHSGVLHLEQLLGTPHSLEEINNVDPMRTKDFLDRNTKCEGGVAVAVGGGGEKGGSFSPAPTPAHHEPQLEVQLTKEELQYEQFQQHYNPNGSKAGSRAATPSSIRNASPSLLSRSAAASPSARYQGYGYGLGMMSRDASPSLRSINSRSPSITSITSTSRRDQRNGDAARSAGSSSSSRTAVNTRTVSPQVANYRNATAGVSGHAVVTDKWTEAVDPKTGRRYWFNRETKTSTWRKPVDL